MVLSLRSSFSFLALFLAFTNVSVAATTSPVSWQPTLDPKSPLGQTLNGMLGNTTYETRATTPAGHPVTRYTKRQTPLSKASAGRMLGTAIKRATPTGLAILAAAELYDYLYDPVTETWSSSPQILDDDIAASGYAYRTNQSYGVTRSHSCALWISWSSASTFTITANGITGYTCNRVWTNGNTVETNLIYYEPYQGFTPQQYQPYMGDSQEVSPETVVDVTPTTLTNDSVTESIQSGNWPQDWPEAVTDATTINDSLENELEGATNADVDTTVSDSATVKVPAPSASGGNTALEFPNFCAWTVVICPFIDWASTVPDAPEQPDIPQLEIELEEFNSSIGAGSCPANIPFTLTFPVAQTFELDLVPICDLATDIKPFTLMSAYLLSAFILIGAIRR